MVQASLKDLTTTGQLGPICLGTTRSLITNVLGEPDDYSQNSRSRQRKQLPPAIWKYGDIELHFADATDQLYLISLKHFTLPSGGPKLQLDPWIIQHTLTVDALQYALEQDHISVQPDRKPYDDPDTSRLRAGIGVEFLFTTMTMPDRSPAGLFAMSYSDLAINV